MTVLQHTAPSVCAQPAPATFNLADAIEQHLPLVQKIAQKAYYRYGQKFEQDDLVGYGHLGLVIAARKYEGLQDSKVDFDEYAEEHIRRHIALGRDRMATIHRKHYDLIKRGQMKRPLFIHDNDEYCMAEAIAAPEDDSAESGLGYALADGMIDWLRGQNPLWAQIVELHTQRGMSVEQVAQAIGRSRSATASLFRRASQLLRWKYNPACYRRDNRRSRSRLAPRRKLPLATRG